MTFVPATTPVPTHKPRIVTRHLLRFSVLLTGLVLSGAGCPGPGGGDGGPGGTCTIDGVSYAPNLASSRVLILVKKKEVGGCSVFHSHAVEAVNYALDCDINSADMANSTMTLTVAISNLDPDAPENRALFPETDDVDLSESDRRIIRGSIEGMLEDTPDSLLTFDISNISALEGADQTLSLANNINDASSTTTMTFTGSRDGANIVWTGGLAVLDGAQHGMPSGFGSDCIESDMDLHLELVLEPGAADAVDPDVVPPFVPTLFPNDAACDDEVGFPDVSQVLVRRCAGCHDSSSLYPLVTFEDWNTDSRGYPDVPRWQTAKDLLELPADETRQMPPIGDATPIPDDDLAIIATWFDAGAPAERCTPVTYEDFIAQARADECGTVALNTPDIQDIFANNGCIFCHDGNLGYVPLLDEDDYSSGLEVTRHSFYQPLSNWETSVERIRDGTMPPYGYSPATGSIESDLLLLDAWVAEGYPATECP